VHKSYEGFIKWFNTKISYLKNITEKPETKRKAIARIALDHSMWHD